MKSLQNEWHKVKSKHEENAPREKWKCSHPYRSIEIMNLKFLGQEHNSFPEEMSSSQML